MNTREGMINIGRLTGTGDRFYEGKPYEIWLDEEQLGSLNVNEHRNYRVEAGEHTIQVKYTALFGSDIIRFRVLPGEMLQFECGGQPGLPQPFVRKIFPSELKKAPSRPLPRAANLGSSDHIFISYRRSDSADISGRIYDRLAGRFGRGVVFKDVDSIPLGVDFKAYVDTKLSKCKVFLAIIGKGWLNAKDAEGRLRLKDPTDVVRIEIESALKRKIPVIPLLVGGAYMPSEKDLPPSLGELVRKNGLPIRADPDFHRDIDRLISSLERYISPQKK